MYYSYTSHKKQREERRTHTVKKKLNIKKKVKYKLLYIYDGFPFISSFKFVGFVIWCDDGCLL